MSISESKVAEFVAALETWSKSISDEQKALLHATLAAAVKGVQARAEAGGFAAQGGIGPKLTKLLNDTDVTVGHGPDVLSWWGHQGQIPGRNM